jgi:hypothetical protein
MPLIFSLQKSNNQIKIISTKSEVFNGIGVFSRIKGSISAYILPIVNAGGKEGLKNGK